LGELRGIILYKDGNDKWVVSMVEIVDQSGASFQFDVQDQYITKDGVKARKS